MNEVHLRFLASLLALIIFSPKSLATILTLRATGDDRFQAFISLDDRQPGRLFLQDGDGYYTVEQGSILLEPGRVHFLHVRAWDVHLIAAGFLAAANLSNADFQFDNGSQVIQTGNRFWRLSQHGFGGPYERPTSYGINGTRPWWFLPLIDRSAHWIWSPSLSDKENYFSLRITPVPEPATLGLLLLSLPILRRRKSKLIR